ncbi:MAG TPA: aminomethyltransferase family protein [Candidatus Nanopelagicales bacterium]|nr:aminomethyltransferase family protein [Candidatus Nanopelagicales bacterium]
MTVGTAFHPRTAPLNTRMQWREWSGFYAAAEYHDSHVIEYNAIREAAALIDVSPLFKYELRGPDALRLVDRLITRDATKLVPGRVFYTPWCDEHGKVIDDGTIHRLDDADGGQVIRWTAADPQYRWLRMNAHGLHVDVADVSERDAAIALQGPLARKVLEAASGEGFADLRYFRRRPSNMGGIPVDVSRTGYTGDLGYEVWIQADRAVEAWDALVAAGEPYRIRPAGMVALDVTRLEAGLVLIEVDYTSAVHSHIPAQNFSPYEIGLGKLVDLAKADYVGKRALVAEIAAGGPARRLVGLEIAWTEIEALYAAEGLAPYAPPTVSRAHVPLHAGGRQVGRVTSTGWSPLLKKMIGLASIGVAHARTGSRVQVEWTVEAQRKLVSATVVDLPFFDPPRKRA